MLFQKLFNFRLDDLRGAERRLLSRYTVAPTFPLTAVIGTAAGDLEGAIIDLSAGGVGLLFKKQPPFSGGTAVSIRFTLEKSQFSSGAIIRYLRWAPAGVQCGIEVGLDDPEGRKNFLQLLIPVSIGATLAKTEGSRPPTPEPDLERTSYGGESGSSLTVWNKTDAARTLDSFEFQVDDYYVRGHAVDPNLHAFSLVDDGSSHRAKDTAPLFQKGGRLEQEIRQLFKWSVLNMGDKIPEPTRKFLRSFRAE